MADKSSFWDDIIPKVDPERCQRCDECVPAVVCLAHGIRRDGPGSVPMVDPALCFGCYSCASACPHGAIILPRKG